MKKALIISAFAGCGKTWLVENQERFKYSMRDSDSSTYKKTEGWEKRYVENILQQANVSDRICFERNGCTGTSICNRRT